MKIDVDAKRLVDRAAQYGRNRQLTAKLLEFGEEGLLTATDRAQIAHLIADAYATGYLACVEDCERTVPLATSPIRQRRGKR